VIADAILLALASAAVAGAYPAWKASRMPIVDALRFNR
jgi:putative ABC transport system permease protein